MIDLILTMLVALDEGENVFLGYTKENINELIKKYNALKEDYNERAAIILWQNKYISDEEFAKRMDIVYEDGKFWMIFDNFEDILSSKYEFEANVLDHEFDWELNWYSNYDKDDIKNYYWKDYNEKTLKAIIKFCIDKGFMIDGELMTYKNTTLKTRKRQSYSKPTIETFDIYFGDKLLTDCFDDLDDIDELIRPLSVAISEAQESADQNEIYEKIKNAFEDEVCEYKTKSVSVKDKNGKLINIYKIYLDLSNIDFDEIEKWLKKYSDDYDFKEDVYGDLYYILREREFFDFTKPDYNYLSGDIDKETLNEYTQNRLE